MLGGTADLRDWRHQDWLIVSTLYLFLLATSFLARKASLSECVARRAIISCSVPFIKIFRKIRFEIKWNTSFWVVPAENVRKQRNIWKGSPVFPDGIVQTEISVQIFFNGFFDTSSGCPVPRRLFLDEHVRAKEGGKETTSVPFPWSLTVHHQLLAFRARLYDAKNEAPEEEAEFQVFAVHFRLMEVICTNGKRDNGKKFKFISPEFCVPLAQTVDQPVCRCKL